MSRWRKIFQLLVGKDIDSNQMHLCVTVLSGLGGGHVDNLAGAALDHDVAVLAQSRTLHREGGRGAGIGRLEGHLMLLRGYTVSKVEIQKC